MEVLALIPARSGSKSIKDKNIRIVGGKPMLVHSVEHALASKFVTRVILSTDSEEYARIGREAGAEVPFIRPAEFAADDSLDIDVFEHALNWLKENEGYEPDIIVHLRPTFPTRDPDDIDKMVDLILDHPEADCVRSVAEAKETPFKMWFVDRGDPSDGDFEAPERMSVSESMTVSESITTPESMAAPESMTAQESGPSWGAGKEEKQPAGSEGQADELGHELGIIKPVVMLPGLEACSMPRQALPKVYLQNACIDVVRTETITEKHSMTGDMVLGYLMKDDCDIDYEEDLKRAEEILSK
ncbi:MAG: acylneuraminate cytidylyltransferase family protein [Lachnospiraceae bacterium]|nr:acylneuraminate cytidylyltransferase family protein [Lachnospiraceae bacterium]